MQEEVYDCPGHTLSSVSDTAQPDGRCSLTCMLSSPLGYRGDSSSYKLPPLLHLSGRDLASPSTLQNAALLVWMRRLQACLFSSLHSLCFICVGL